MVEWDGLENRCTGNGTVGSNPTLSAINLYVRTLRDSPAKFHPNLIEFSLYSANRYINNLLLAFWRFYLIIFHRINPLFYWKSLDVALSIGAPVQQQQKRQEVQCRDSNFRHLLTFLILW